MSNQKGIVRLAKTSVIWSLNQSTKLINRMFSNRTGSFVLKKYTSNLPHSNGSRFYERFPVNIGIVADPFVLRNYEPTCNLLPMTPDNWKERLNQIDCLLVTSAWRGQDGEWIGASHYQSSKRRELLTMMQEAKKRNCPVVFYSKEDPPNYNVFLEFAKEADYIFTSARECISDYQAVCPKAKVDVLTFAINPLLHNPIGSEEEKIENTVFFAGSWMEKYPERIRKMNMMFHLFLNAGLKLHIADRNFSRNDFRYQYPFRYLRHVLGDFAYEQIAEMYKVYPWCMNINSVTSSDTMFAMRVYDALASGAQVLSNDSQGIRQRFPEVHIIQNATDLDTVLSLSQETLKKNKVRAIRSVLRQGTVFEKMEHVLRTAGVISSAERKHMAGVILPDNLTEDQRKLLEAMFEAQSYPHKVLVEAGSELWSNCDMLCLWGPDREYGTYYLEDMVNGFKFTDCDYVTKRCYPIGNSLEYTYTDCITDLYATVFWSSAISPDQLMALPENDITFPNGFASDCDNYTVHPINGESI